MIKKLFIPISALFVAGGISPLWSASTIDLSFEEALNRATEANFQYLIAAQGLEIQKQSTEISRSALLPSLSLSVSQSRSMSPNVSGFARSIPNIPNRNFIDRFDALIRTRMSLLNFEDFDQYRISRLELESSRLELDNTIQQILQSIGSAYLDYWRSKERLDVIKANIERDRTILRITRDQKEAGVATPLDVTRAEVQVSTNELALLQQETVVLNTDLNLKRILNYSLDAKLNIAELPIPEDRSTYAYSSNLLRAALNSRPDYQSALSVLEQAELSLSASKRQRLPSLTLEGQWGVASRSIEEDMAEQWQVGIGLSMPIFEGFRIQSETRQSMAELRQQETALDELKLSIESELRVALQELRSRYNQLEVARQTLQLNKREYELAKIRFEEGVADNRDLVDAQARLADGEDSLIEAEYRYLLGRIQLARVVGDVRRAMTDNIY